jgi:hypothetical protein
MCKYVYAHAVLANKVSSDLGHDVITSIQGQGHGKGRCGAGWRVHAGGEGRGAKGQGCSTIVQWWCQFMRRAQCIEGIIISTFVNGRPQIIAFRTSGFATLKVRKSHATQPVNRANINIDSTVAATAPAAAGRSS